MFDVNTIVETGGLLAVALIIFAECGILLGFFLPGDTLLLAAGLFAARGKMSIFWLVFTVIFAAIIGYEVGYMLGRRAGPKIFNRHDGFLFRKEYMGHAEKFFDKYGGLTVVVARFVAHVRTFVSVIAGASNMNRKQFFAFNVIGSVLWAGSITLAGYWLGVNVPNIDKILVPLVIVALILFYTVGLWQLLKTPQRRHRLKTGLKEDWNYFFRINKKSS
ncbi:MAG TPA: DedA family protein [Candidatus Saccharimonadales bacterium]|nr:DedA family protein [Candidatus Saccharimonadales bacterium]